MILFLTNSFKEYKDKFINTLLYSEDFRVQKAAMRLFMLGNKHVSVLVSEAEELKNYANNLNEQSNFYIICNIIQTCVNNFPSCISDALSFVPSLIKFAFSYQIVSMFEDLLDPINDLTFVYNFFNEANLFDSIVNLYNKSDLDCKQGLLRIIKCMLINQITNQKISQLQLHEIIEDAINSESTTNKNLGWSIAFIDIRYFGSSVIDQAKLFEDSASAICQNETTGFLEYQVNALQCMNTIMVSVLDSIADFDFKNVIRKLLDVYMKCPGHSIAYQAIFDFVINLSNNSKYRSLIFNSFVPDVMETAKTSKNTTQISFANDFFMKLSLQVFNDETYRNDIPSDIYQYLSSFKVDTNSFSAFFHPSIADFPDDIMEEVLFAGL